MVVIARKMDKIHKSASLLLFYYCYCVAEPVVKHLPASHRHDFIFTKFMHRKNSHMLLEVSRESPRRGGLLPRRRPRGTLMEEGNPLHFDHADGCMGVNICRHFM